MKNLYLLCTLLFICISLVFSKSKNLKILNESNWKDVLTGEWMVEFYAPWCPACKDLQKSWNSFADWSKDLKINVAEVDVISNPGLSGRFLVTALPTIYHVKNGVFRIYAGPRDKNDFISFVEDKRWSFIKPISAYKNPDSIQMSIVALFFRLSMFVRDIHVYLTEGFNVPSWVSYAGFAAITLTLGCILGFFIVCIIDYVFPTDVSMKKLDEKKNSKKNQKSKSSNNNEKSIVESSSQVLDNFSDVSVELIGEKSPPKSNKKSTKADSKKNK